MSIISTYIYLQCLDHNPPLRATYESGQHLYDLPRIRQDIRDREVLVRLWSGGDVDLGFKRNHTAQFLAQHQECVIGIVSEYGEQFPLVDPEEEQ